jgi:TatD DNase family protein
MLIDTHCHLDFKDFDNDRDEVIARARDAGILKIINVASSIEGTRRASELAKKYEAVYATVGIHPHAAETVTDEAIDELKKIAKEDKVVAVGEVGLDYYRNLAPKDRQADAFRRFIRLAVETGKPLIIHSREADNDILGILREECGNTVKGVVHCFAGDEKFLEDCLGMGLYISFTANLTFKKADNLRTVAKRVPIERLMLETDAPFLAPQDVRGKRNEPAYLTYLVKEWENISGLSAEDIARITTHNANRLFGLNIREDTRIVYPIRGSLYLNITNRCTNNCYFCVRNSTEFVKGHNLKLDKEPSEPDVLAAMGDPKKYKEIVFCGYGEPTIRLDEVKSISRKMKALGLKVRLVTNGHGDLINKRPIAAELSGLIDRISVSMNAEDADKYEKICEPAFGALSYKAVLDFIKDCVNNKIDVEVTCLDLPEIDMAKCESLARSLGARFRPRSYGVVG